MGLSNSSKKLGQPISNHNSKETFTCCGASPRTAEASASSQWAGLQKLTTTIPIRNMRASYNEIHTKNEYSHQVAGCRGN